MSKICICILADYEATPDAIDDLLHMPLKHFGLKLFHNLTYQEPLQQQYLGQRFTMFSISDSDRYDNCDVLLLPDNCSINGVENILPFQSRMLYLETVFRMLLRITSNIDVFFGESGTDYSDFSQRCIVVDEFLSDSTCMNCVNQPDIHYRIVRSVD